MTILYKDPVKLVIRPFPDRFCKLYRIYRGFGFGRWEALRGAWIIARAVG